MHPTAQHARSINGQQSSLDQERNHARAKQLLQPRVITGKMRVCRATLFLSEFASEFSSAHHMKPSLAIKQAVGYQRVQVRMKVEIFAESVDRHDDGWNAIVRRVANAACIWSQVDRRTLSIAGRAISALIATQGLGDLYRLYLDCQRDGVDCNVAYIPPDFDVPAREAFDPTYMKALFERGYELARNGSPWHKFPPGFDKPFDTPPRGP